MHKIRLLTFLFSLLIGAIWSFNFIIKSKTAPYLFDHIEAIPQKEFGLILGANKFNTIEIG